MHPFLDLQNMTDEQILSRLGKAYSIMAYQTSLGHDSTVHSIREVITSLENEKNSRSQKSATAEFNKKYANDLAPIELGKLE